MISKAMVFPGQGSQYIGMGKSFYDNYKLVKDIYDRASDLLHFDVAKPFIISLFYRSFMPD